MQDKVNEEVIKILFHNRWVHDKAKARGFSILSRIVYKEAVDHNEEKRRHNIRMVISNLITKDQNLKFEKIEADSQTNFPFYKFNVYNLNLQNIYDKFFSHMQQLGKFMCSALHNDKITHHSDFFFLFGYFLMRYYDYENKNCFYKLPIYNNKRCNQAFRFLVIEMFEYYGKMNFQYTSQTKISTLASTITGIIKYALIEEDNALLDTSLTLFIHGCQGSKRLHYSLKYHDIAKDIDYALQSNDKYALTALSKVVPFVWEGPRNSAEIAIKHNDVEALKIFLDMGISPTHEMMYCDFLFKKVDSSTSDGIKQLLDRYGFLINETQANFYAKSARIITMTGILTPIILLSCTAGFFLSAYINTLLFEPLNQYCTDATEQEFFCKLSQFLPTITYLTICPTTTFLSTIDAIYQINYSYYRNTSFTIETTLLKIRNFCRNIMLEIEQHADMATNSITLSL